MERGGGGEIILLPVRRGGRGNGNLFLEEKNASVFDFNSLEERGRG